MVVPLVQLLPPRSICVGVQGDSVDLVIKTDTLPLFSLETRKAGAFSGLTRGERGDGRARTEGDGMTS